MGITVRGIHEHDFLLVHHPFCKFFRSQFIQKLPGSFRHIFMGSIQHRKLSEVRFFLVSCAGISVHRNIGDVGKELRAPVGNKIRFLEEPGVAVNIVDIALAFLEIPGTEHVLQEVNIGLHAGNPEFIQAAEHLVDCVLGMKGMGGHLHKKGIIVRSNDSARIGCACIETDARTAAAPVRNDFARIRHKVILRIFRGNTALDSHTLIPDIFLLADGNLRSVQGIAFGNEDLALHNIDIRNHFRYRMFYLYTGVDFNEVEMFFILVYQEFYGARIHIVDMLHQFHCRIADALAQFHRQGPGRCHFNYLLVTALDRAVSFKEMHHIALFITHNLYFNVLWVHDALFYIHIFIAKSHFSFRLCPVIGFFQIFHAVHVADTPSAAAINSLDHDGEAVLFCKSLHFFKALHRTIGTGNHGDARFFCLDTGIDLITEHHEVFYLRPDENNALFFTPFSKLCIFCQESVARMDGIYSMLLADTNDIFDIEIGINRLIPFAYQVCFISPVAMQGKNIFLGINGYSANSQFTAGAEYTNSNLASVGNKDLANTSHKILPQQYGSESPALQIPEIRHHHQME